MATSVVGLPGYCSIICATGPRHIVHWRRVLRRDLPNLRLSPAAVPYRVLRPVGAQPRHVWAFGFRLSGSREVAFLAMLLAGLSRLVCRPLLQHRHRIRLALLFLLPRGIQLLPGPPRTKATTVVAAGCGTLAVLYVCALNAKEMAVTLPVMLAAYEVIYHRRSIREYRGVLVTALMTVPYVIGKLTGAGSLVETPSYRLTISPGRYLDTFHLYLNPLLYQEHVFRDPNTIQLLIAMLAVALLLRSKPLLFAWCFVLISLLPVAFIAHYAGFFLYLPMAGWSLYAAVAAGGGAAIFGGKGSGSSAAGRLDAGIAGCRRSVSGAPASTGARQNTADFRERAAAFQGSRGPTDCSAPSPTARGAGPVRRRSVPPERILSAISDAPALWRHDHHGRKDPARCAAAGTLRRGVHVPRRSCDGSAYFFASVMPSSVSTCGYRLVHRSKVTAGVAVLRDGVAARCAGRTLRRDVHVPRRSSDGSACFFASVMPRSVSTFGFASSIDSKLCRRYSPA